MKFILSTTASVCYHDEIVDATAISKHIRGLEKRILDACPKRDQRVLIFLDHNPSVLYSMFAVLSLGMTYIPVDPSLPSSRVDYIRADCQAGVVITSREYKGLFSDIRVVDIDSDIKQDTPVPASETVEFEKEKTAYIIYTSGTTGVPKGVAISYGAIVNFMEGFSERVSFRVDDRIACITNIGFDIFFIESIFALLNGVSIIMADQNESSSPRILATMVRQYAVSVLQITPSRLKLLAECDPTFSCFATIRLLLVGGEPFPVELLKSLQHYTNAQIYNLYGPTEATIWTTVADLTYSPIVHIGLPIKNTSVYVVDEMNNQVQPNQFGEIVITGPCLAQGYLNNDTLTGQSFIHLSFQNGVRAYKTGDYGEYDENGFLHCNGRLDNQIKYHGYRIEPEEIEAVMEMADGVTESLVIYDSTLKAYYVGPEISLKSWRDLLCKKLPEYMIPTVFIRLHHFHHTVNGKLDRKYPYNGDASGDSSALDIFTGAEVIDPIYDAISKIIKQCIGLDSDEVLDPRLKLDEIGMDSYGFIQAIVSIEERFGIEFEDRVLSFRHFPNAVSFVEYVKERLRYE